MRLGNLYMDGFVLPARFRPARRYSMFVPRASIVSFFNLVPMKGAPSTLTGRASASFSGVGLDGNAAFNGSSNGLTRIYKSQCSDFGEY